MNIPSSFQLNRPLKDYTTFGIGGEARYFVEVHQIEKMKEVMAFCHKQNLLYFILGKGSNTLFDDQGFPGVVIANRITFFEKPNEDQFHIGAGYSFSLLGTQSARQGWSGLEFASGIPGSIGGAVYMNAGANGHETCETLMSVDYITETGELVTFSRQQLAFHYRFSSFQQMKGAIVGATFRLIPSSLAREKQLEIIRYRQKTQPTKEKSAGCVFRNPPNHHAGALIEKSGLKGKKIGEAQVCHQHANFVINTSNATAQHVLDLISYIQQEVKEKQGIELTPEIRYVSYPFLEQDQT
jgi:UDP-N-acetylmuramate dehydrogenase